MRILIADDQPKVRFALRVALERQLGAKVVGEAIDTTDLLTQARYGCPDLILLDWELTDMPAIDVLRELRQMCAKVIVIALSEKSEMRPAALAAGADAFVSKGDPPEHLQRAISEGWNLALQAHTKIDCTLSAL